MPEIAYVNGEFLPLDQAMIHVEDRGFQFADAVYEVIRTYHGEPFAVDEHLARLFRSMEGIQLQPAFTVDQLKLLVADAVRRAGFGESVIYLQITRGRAPRHRGFPVRAEPTLVITVGELHAATHLREMGVSVVTVSDNRWARCDVKSVALLANVLAYHAAKKAGTHDAIFIGSDGFVNEATAGNVFALINGRLLTPPKGPRVLSGVTRDKILQAARKAGMQPQEEQITRTDLLKSEEIFLTSTTAEVVPVIAVDGKNIGTGRPGPIMVSVYERFLEMFVQK